jgi:hypothetical protein
VADSALRRRRRRDLLRHLPQHQLHEHLLRGLQLLRLRAPQARGRRLRPHARGRGRARARGGRARRVGSLHPGRHPPEQGRLLVPRDRARDQGGAARPPHPRVLARGDPLRPAEVEGNVAARLPRDAPRRGPRHDPGHGGRDPRRRDPRSSSPRKP